MPAAKTQEDPRANTAVAEVLGQPRRQPAACNHRPPSGFRPKNGVQIEIAVPTGRNVASARLLYRHVNQAERYETIEMESRENVYGATIPGSYTDSPYPLQYYFEFKEVREKAWLYPGFAEDLANQPYFVLRRI